MARLLEHHSMQLLQEAGAPMVPFGVASIPAQMTDLAQSMGLPLIVKALVPVGGRGKGGVVRFVSTVEEGAEAAKELLGQTFKNYRIEALLVSPVIEIAQEWFLSITFNETAHSPVVLFSTRGGVDIETIAHENPEYLITRTIDITLGLEEYAAREICAEAGLSGNVLLKAADFMVKAYKVFRQYDARMVEVNPIVLTKDGQVLAPTGVLNIDDRATGRHPEMEQMLSAVDSNGWRPFTEFEKQMQAVDALDPNVGHIRFNEFPDGDLALMVTGGGAGAIAFDTLVALGALPATTFDITMGQIEEKMCEATKLVLSRRGLKGLLAGANFANFSPVDIKVRGVVRALKELGIDGRKFPVVLRFCGPNQDLAASLVGELSGVEYLDERTTIEDAARRMVERIREVTGQ
jgi:succinyl-CoA synthetase beta subunit